MGVRVPSEGLSIEHYEFILLVRRRCSATVLFVVYHNILANVNRKLTINVPVVITLSQCLTFSTSISRVLNAFRCFASVFIIINKQLPAFTKHVKYIRQYA